MIKTLLSVFLFCTSFSASALKCIPDAVPVDEIEDIGKVSVPLDVPVGTRLWSSKEITRNVTCKSDGPKEYVYFYGNPDNAPIRQGIGMGVIYNGRDLGIVQSGSKVRTDIYLDGIRPSEGTIKFQVYLEKTGQIGAGTNFRSIAVFQLDGEGGINAFPGNNYRYSAGGINNIQVTNCSVDISVPSEIDFGIVGWDTKGQVVGTRDIVVRGIKSSGCKNTDKLGVDLIFDPIGNLENGSKHFNLENGSVLRLMEGVNPINFRFPVRFWSDVASGNVQERTYRAEILSTGTALTGDYSHSIMIHVNYF